MTASKIILCIHDHHLNSDSCVRCLQILRWRGLWSGWRRYRPRCRSRGFSSSDSRWLTWTGWTRPGPHVAVDTWPHPHARSAQHLPVSSAHLYPHLIIVIVKTPPAAVGLLLRVLLVIIIVKIIINILMKHLSTLINRCSMVNTVQSDKTLSFFNNQAKILQWIVNTFFYTTSQWMLNWL